MAKRNKDIDVEKVRKQAAEITHAVGEQAQALGTKAAFFAHEAGEWASPKVRHAREVVEPKVEEARDYLAPKVEKAWKDTVKAAAPKLEAATESVRPMVDEAYEKVVEDYLPRIQQAMHDAAAAAAADGSLAERAEAAGHAAERALAKQPKSHKGAKAVGWVLVGTVAAGAGYLLWRRTQPVEDPWAEEYWQDVDNTPAAAPAEAEAVDAEETIAAEAAVPTADEPAAEEAADDAADAVAEAADEETRS